MRGCTSSCPAASSSSRPAGSWRPIVASAERGALPHAGASDAEIPPDTLVTLDVGAVLDGYCSDCTRTWATGTPPDDLLEAYELVRRAQEEALAAVRPGPPGRGGVRIEDLVVVTEAGHEVLSGSSKELTAVG